MIVDDDPFIPDFDLGQFRYAVAKHVKSLIISRGKCDPGFLTPGELDRWGLRNIAEDLDPAWRSMMEATEVWSQNREDFTAIRKPIDTTSVSAKPSRSNRSTACPEN